MKPNKKAFSVWSIAFCAGLQWCAVPSASADACEPWAGRVVSRQGQIQLLRANGVAQPVSLQQTLCPGDRLSVGQNSRAEVLLPNETVLRLDEDTVFNLIAPSTGKRSWVELVRGVVHFLSRVHGTLDIKTPFINATIEGTELVLKVDDRETQLWVLEGKVRFANEFGSLQVNTGQSAAAEKGKAPVYRLLIKPRDAVQWALYYPPIVDYRPGAYAASPASRYLDEAIANYRRGDLSNALNQLERAPPEYRDNHYFAVHAALLLSSGRVDEANQDIQQELRLRPNDATPHALRAIIALAQNRKDEALTEARRATELEPNSPIGHIALSYAQQAAFNLDKATESTQRAIGLSPDNALAHARLAELELSRGYRSQGIAAAKKAAQLEPRLARTHTVLGFAYLTEIKIDEAKLAFERAIHLDSTDPLARLGLGLAKIRKGKLKEGTEELELATSLDPNNSLIRSYLGKAYYEQRRPKIAETEFKNAKELDPKDPTPYFYDAIHKQTTNRPVEALQDMQKATELNENRAVYRSRLLVDQDRASRSTGLARISSDLGFELPALVEASKSLSIDPANYSAHRFLSDTYANLPRHEIARVSELLQAQLLQPLNSNPAQPRLNEFSLNIVAGTGPPAAGFNEFAPLFERNRVRLLTSAFGGNNGTWGDEAVLSGLYDRVAFSLGQFHSNTAGFRKNNDIENNLYNVFAQIAVTPTLDIQTEYRRRETDQGDLQLKFDPTDFLTGKRRTVRQDTGRLGIHWGISPRSDFIASLIYSNPDDFQTISRTRTVTDFRTADKGYQFETQYLFRTDIFNLTAGLSTYDIDVDQSLIKSVIRTKAIESSFQSTFTRSQDIAYIYSNLNWPKPFIWTAGFSYDSYKEHDISLANNFHPKLGLQFYITENVRLRMAYMETVKRALVVEQTIEPTQVAGFNQFFDDLNGTLSTRYGIGLDTQLSTNLKSGFEVSKRELHKVPSFNPNTNSFDSDAWHEDLYRAYFNWTLFHNWAINMDYYFERFKLTKREVTDGPGRVDTMTVPLAIRYFNPSGLSAKLGITYVRQDIDPGPSSNLLITSDDFVTVDAALGYRLPRRWGIINIEARNLFDEKFLYQDENFRTSEERNPRFIPDRTFLAKITLNF